MVEDEELFGKVVDLLQNSNDSMVQLNALNIVTSLILRDDIENSYLLDLVQKFQPMFAAMIKRGLKSCSANINSLTRSLQAIHRLLVIDFKDDRLAWTSPLKIVARLVNSGGIEMLSEA